MYDKKLKEYKEKQEDLLLQMEDHSKADENFYITAAAVLDLSSRALEIFESSEVNEKRTLLNFLLQNCILNGRKLLFELKTPFDIIETSEKVLADSADYMGNFLLLFPNSSSLNLTKVRI